MTSPALAAANSTWVSTEETEHATCSVATTSATVTVPHVADKVAPVVALVPAKVMVYVPAWV